MYMKLPLPFSVEQIIGFLAAVLAIVGVIAGIAVGIGKDNPGAPKPGQETSSPSVTQTSTPSSSVGIPDPITTPKPPRDIATKPVQPTGVDTI